MITFNISKIFLLYLLGEISVKFITIIYLKYFLYVHVYMTRIKQTYTKYFKWTQFVFDFFFILYEYLVLILKYRFTTS